jgi:Sulfotransferase family
VPADRVGFLVVGSPRSGTTLVQRLACEIPGVAMPPETHFFSDFAWDLVRRHEFPLGGAELRDEIARFAALDNARGLGIDPDAILEDLGGRSDSVYGLFDEITRLLAGPAEVWGEKTPGHLWWWRPISVAAPWMRFVVVVRDPRAVVASLLSMPWQAGIDMELWEGRLHALHAGLAGKWAFDQEVAAALLEELSPDRALLLRYEDLVSDPDRARTGIAKLLGRSTSDDLQQAPTSMVHPWEHWKQRAMQDVSSDRVESWRADLGERRAADVAWICRRQMARFGYPRVLRSDLVAGLRNRGVRADLAELLDRLRHYGDRIAEIEL